MLRFPLAACTLAFALACGAWALADDAAPPAVTGDARTLQLWYCDCAKATWIHTGGKLACPCAQAGHDCKCKHELRQSFALSVAKAELIAGKEGKVTLSVQQVASKDGKEERTPLAGASVKAHLQTHVKGYVCPMKQCLPEGQSETETKCPKCGMNMKEGQVVKALGADAEAKVDAGGCTLALTAASAGDFELAVRVVTADKVELATTLPITVAK
ncbi:MAG: hypothetical protein HYZ53_07420 [Planctomycetes bacterium]|nr:hypothetical protein [Planctomycetota bacterium]